MTPMQKLKPQFDILKEILDDWKEVALNQSEEKNSVTSFCGERTEYHNKGVKSDFIKTFKAEFNDENSYSIGFSFKYFDIPQSEQTIQVSLKIGNKEPLYYIGKHLSIEMFRTQLNQIIERVKMLEEKNYKSIVKIIHDDFKLLPNHHPKVKNHSQRKMKK